MMAVVKESRDLQKFGFDDPTYDLVRAIERGPSRGLPPFGSARGDLETLVGGRVLEQKGQWLFEKSQTGNKVRIPVSITSEGVKKIAIVDIVDRLIVNRSLAPGAVLFIDEPESFLHPSALLRFLEILDSLVKVGVQVVMATHSILCRERWYSSQGNRLRGSPSWCCPPTQHQCSTYSTRECHLTRSSMPLSDSMRMSWTSRQDSDGGQKCSLG